VPNEPNMRCCPKTDVDRFALATDREAYAAVAWEGYRLAATGGLVPRALQPSDIRSLAYTKWGNCKPDKRGPSLLCLAAAGPRGGAADVLSQRHGSGCLPRFDKMALLQYHIP
jgi:hypothetical protein